MALLEAVIIVVDDHIFNLSTVADQIEKCKILRSYVITSVTITPEITSKNQSGECYDGCY